ncbi:8953_t:CDS:1, partial [Funneliformis mosseae]
MSARFREISARCDELEVLYEIAYEIERVALQKWKLLFKLIINLNICTGKD